MISVEATSARHMFSCMHDTSIIPRESKQNQPRRWHYEYRQSFSKETQKVNDRRLFTWIAASPNICYSIVIDKLFIDLIHSLNPSYKLPCLRMVELGSLELLPTFERKSPHSSMQLNVYRYVLICRQQLMVIIISASLPISIICRRCGRFES